MKNHMIVLVLCSLIVGYFEVAHAGDYDISRDENTRSGTLNEGRVQKGRIINVRNVRIEPTATAQATGTALGALVGGIAGNKMRGRNGGYSAAAVGSVLGGIAGNVTTDMLTHDTAQELIIEKSDGQNVVISQAGSDMEEGELVYIVESVGKKRVIPR